MVQFPVHFSSWVIMHPRSVTPIARSSTTRDQNREQARAYAQMQQRAGRFYAQA